MLQGIRASTLTMPSFGHDMSLAGVQKIEGYGGDTDSWSWPQHSAPHQPPYSSVYDSSLYSFAPQTQAPARGLPRHHSIAAPHVATGTNTPPPARPQVAGNMVKAQPAFKPTWHGFLDTTKDAMTVVEASLQGRLSHISRRPHDKERAEMLTSGTVLVYEENASGIKRWTDAVHWSPSRVMNNCLIYRQLVRALKPEEKKTALNPSCGTKRKRKESAGPAMTKTGENINNSDDEYENPSYDGSLPGDADSINKVYANFAQNLTPDQQRRFCGSLIDSYEFKEGGLMKKTISVKYQGTHHHVISYYSLEDVVSGKLKRPCQDPKLADIQPRPDLLNGWKVSLEDEESKDLPVVPGYPHHLQPSHLQHQVLGTVTPTGSGQPVMQSHTPLHLHVPEYWQNPHVSQYTPTHHSPQNYSSPQSATSQYPTSHPAHQYHAQQSSPQTYTSQQAPAQQYVQPASPEHYSPPPSSSPQFSAPAAPTPQFAPQTTRHYSFDASHNTSASIYSQTIPAPQYQQPTSNPSTQSNQFAVPQTATFDLHAPVSQSVPPPSVLESASQSDTQRRASAPVTMQSYSQSQYQSAPYPQSYFVTDSKHTPESHHGY